MYEINAKTKSTKRAMLLYKVSLVGEIIFAGGSIAYMLFAFLGFLYSFVGYFWLHEFRPMLIIYIPFLDEKTADGFAIVMAVQTVEIFFRFCCKRQRWLCVCACSYKCLDFYQYFWGKCERTEWYSTWEQSGYVIGKSKASKYLWNVLWCLGVSETRKKFPIPSPHWGLAST